MDENSGKAFRREYIDVLVWTQGAIPCSNNDGISFVLRQSKGTNKVYISSEFGSRVSEIRRRK